MKDLRIPHERIAQAIGRDRSAATKMLSGKRSVKINELGPLNALIDEFRRAEVRGASAQTTFDTKPLGSVAPQGRVEPRFLPVRYRVRAGLWEEVEFSEPPVQVSLPVLPDPRFASWPQWLELVEGDSVDLKIPPGHYAHVIDAIEMGYAAKDGDWVVVERRRDQGRTRERTIKQIEIGADRVVRLRTRSHNPMWTKHAALAFKDGRPVTDGGESLALGDTTEVEIVGLVIGSYNPDF